MYQCIQNSNNFVHRNTSDDKNQHCSEGGAHNIRREKNLSVRALLSRTIRKWLNVHYLSCTTRTSVTSFVLMEYHVLHMCQLILQVLNYSLRIKEIKFYAYVKIF